VAFEASWDLLRRTLISVQVPSCLEFGEEIYMKSAKMKMRWQAEEGKLVPSYSCLWPKDSAVRNTKGVSYAVRLCSSSCLLLILLCWFTRVRTRPPGCMIHHL
jgi:hypothetical protein